MSDITLLDGGMGQELVKRSGDPATPLWSTQVMIDHPGLVQQVHTDYFEAGATVATTNTYAILRDRLEKFGRAEDFERLLDLALSEASAARDAHGSGRIAGSHGPLGASYRTDILPPLSESIVAYDEVASMIADRVDFILCETIASVEQAEAAMIGAGRAGKPVWLGVTVMDEDGRYLRSGEAVDDLAPVVAAHGPAALLINCSVPEVIADALEIAKSFGVPFGAYANGFTGITAAFLKDAPTVDALQERQDMGPHTYADHAMGWVAQGATIVGGCCEVGPAHIAELARRLKAEGHQIV
ncbi:MAG: homocysteine S-methyltransferase family protein [Brevirhabdus sp.]